MQLSCVPPPPELVVGRACGTDWVKVGTPVVTEPGVLDVGRGREVLVGGSVGLGVSVGGMGVEVGIAPCVSATIVSAAASAVC